jgi:hypothetical protein
MRSDFSNAAQTRGGALVKQYRFLGLVLLVAGLHVGRAAADESMEFSLNEVEHGSEPVLPKAALPKPATASSGSPLADALGELRWGMNRSEVLRLIKNRMQAEFQARVKLERDIVRQDAMYQEAKQRFDQIKNSYITFDATKNGWDVSPIADEFRRGNDEGMLVMEDASARSFYFFMHGKLWKWYRELKADKEGGYAAVTSMIREQFSELHADKTQRGEGEAAIPGVSWSDANTRVTLIRRGADVCLIFEDRATLDQLSVLRRNAFGRQQARNGALDAVLMNDVQKKAWVADDPRVTGEGRAPQAPTRNHLQ